MKKLLFTLLCNTVFLFMLQGQANKDCIDALVLCGDEPIHIDFSPGSGIDDSGVENTCVGFEFNAIWIELNISGSGQLLFEIAPDDPEGDIDFVVYKLSNNDCESKAVVRCMATGLNVGQDTTNQLSCLGNTGLAIGEIDLIENPGCSNGDNNFLAPMSVLEGEQYVILVNDFTFSDAGFVIQFGGSAQLDCAVSHTEEPPTAEDLFEIHYSLSNIDITINDLNAQTGQLNVMNPNGQLVDRYEVKSGDQISINTAQFSGVYYLVLETPNQVFSKKLIGLN